MQDANDEYRNVPGRPTRGRRFSHTAPSSRAVRKPIGVIILLVVRHVSPSAAPRECAGWLPGIARPPGSGPAGEAQRACARSGAERGHTFFFGLDDGLVIEGAQARSSTVAQAVPFPSYFLECLMKVGSLSTCKGGLLNFTCIRTTLLAARLTGVP